MSLLLHLCCEKVVLNAEKSKEESSKTSIEREDFLNPLIAKGLFDMTAKLGLNADERKVY